MFPIILTIPSPQDINQWTTPSKIIIPSPNYNSGYRFPTPTEPMPNMQAPSHEAMKKWYSQGMRDANKQHVEMVKRANQVLDERTNSVLVQENDMNADDGHIGFLKGLKMGSQIQTS